MSLLKSYKSFLIDIGTPLVNWKDEIKGHLTTAGWTLVTDNPAYIEVLPIGVVGNENGYELLRINFTSTDVNFESRAVLNYSVPASYIFNLGYYPPYAINNSPYLMSNAVTVETYTLTVSTNQIDQTAELLSKIQASTVPELLKFNFSLSADLINIIATEKVPGDSAPLSFGGQGTGNSVPQEGAVVGKNVRTGTRYYQNWGATVDFATGFIYFLSIFERSIQLAIKTTTSYYGPIFAEFIDNSVAAYGAPKSCIPIEMLTGELQSGIPTNGAQVIRGDYVSPGFSYGILDKRNDYPGPIRYLISNNIKYKSKLTNIIVTNLGSLYYGLVLENYSGGVKTFTQDPPTCISFYGSGSVVAMSTSGYTTNGPYVGYVPPMRLADTYAFITSATNESLHLAQDIDYGAALVTAVNTVDGAFSIGDTSNFPVAGTIIAGNEIMEYTSKTATVLNGVTRGLYGTTAAAHDAATVVYPAKWYVKINGGAILAGYSKPTGT